MNKGQKVLAGILGLVAVELLPVSVVATRAIVGGIEVTYEVDEKKLEEEEKDLKRAMRAAKEDMGEEIMEDEDYVGE